MSVIYETEDISKFKFNKNDAYNTKSRVATHEFIESIEAIKVTCESGEVSYFNPCMFDEVFGKSEEMYLTTVYPKKYQMLIGIKGSTHVLLAPYSPHSVERYLK